MLGPPKETVINGADMPLVCVINNKCFDPLRFWPKAAGITGNPLTAIMELYWFILAKTPAIPRRLIDRVERGAGSPCGLMTLAGWQKASENFFKANRIDGKNKESGRMKKRRGACGREDLPQALT